MGGGIRKALMVSSLGVGEVLGNGMGAFEWLCWVQLGSADDGEIRIWDSQHGQLTRTIRQHKGAVMTITVAGLHVWSGEA